jgi:alpha/beta superfamily hydrolase
LKDLPALISELEQLSDDRIEQMEDEIARLVEDYFTFEGVMGQIEQFMVNPQHSALICQPLPKHPGTKRHKHFG